MSAKRYMSAGFVLHAPPGRRIATLLAVAVFGATGAAALMRHPDPAAPAGRAAVVRAAAATDGALAGPFRAAVAEAGADVGLASAMAAYAGRFPALVADDVFGLGRIRVAAMLARAPVPGFREPSFEETLADTYDLRDPAVARFVDRVRADPAAAARLVTLEIAFQRRTLGERLGVGAADVDPAILHVAVRFGTRAGEIMNLVAEGAGPAQLPTDYAVDPAVRRATGAADGIEVLQAFSGDLAGAPAPAPRAPGRN